MARVGGEKLLVRHADKFFQRRQLGALGGQLGGAAGGLAALLQILDGPQRGLNLVGDVVRNEHDFLGHFGLVIKFGETGLKRLVQALQIPSAPWARRACRCRADWSKALSSC